MSGQTKPFRVEVHGGESDSDRQLLATSISALLTKEGFKDVRTSALDGTAIVPKRMMKATVFDVVEKTAPHLFVLPIRVKTMESPLPEDVLRPDGVAKLKLEASGKNGTHMSDTRGDVNEFVQWAEDMGATDEITVSSTSAKVIGKAVTEILELNPRISLTAKVSEVKQQDNIVIGQF